jgi:hypothetical protein
MDARVNISNQEVFRLARSVDKDGFRTVGVITKCDALQPGDEKEVNRSRSCFWKDILTVPGPASCTKLRRAFEAWMVSGEEPIYTGHFEGRIP